MLSGPAHGRRRPSLTTNAAAAGGGAGGGPEGEWQEWHNPRDFGPPLSRPAAPLRLVPAVAAAVPTGAGWLQGNGQAADAEAAAWPAAGPWNAVVVLNTDCVGPLLHRFWAQAHMRVCADGGANRLYDAAGEEALVPHYIKGDLDSLRPEVGRHFEMLGTRVIRDPDQDTNDLQKCLELLRCGELGEEEGRVAAGSDYTLPATPWSARTNVFVLGSLGLRFDHAMATVHLLHKYQGAFRRVVLLGPESLVFLLPPGKHRIHVDRTLEGPVCGLIPMAGPCRSVTTRGLRWDLNGQALALGGLVSTSNEVLEDAKVVEVEATDPLVWTTTVRPQWRNASVAID